MGLYDTLHCQSAQLEPALRELEFQTKDLECGMDDYTITPDGRLLHTLTVWEPVPENERPYWGTPQWADPMCQAFGCVRSVPVREEDTHYHGDVRFYGYDRAKTFREFVARFTEGQLTWIKEIRVEPAATVKLDADPA